MAAGLLSGVEQIFIFGEIGPFGMSADEFARQLAATSGNEVEVVISSPGGMVSEGLAIRALISQSNKKITTVGMGQVASIAVSIFLAGAQRKLAKDATLMIHQPWTSAGGNASDLEGVAGELRMAEKNLLEYYVERTGQSAESLTILMGDESSMTAQQAVDGGFAHELLVPVQAMAVYDIGTKSTKNNLIMSAISKLAAKVDALLGIRKTAELKALTLTLEDGRKIGFSTSDSMVVVGTGVSFIENTDGVPDAVYVLSDGRSVDVVGGQVVGITEAPATEQVPDTGAPAPAVVATDDEKTKMEEEMAAMAGVLEKVVTGLTEQLSATNARLELAMTGIVQLRALTGQYIPDESISNAPKAVATARHQPGVSTRLAEIEQQRKEKYNKAK